MTGFDVRIPPPPELDGPCWDSLVQLAADLGGGDPARGLRSVVGIVRNVRSDAALATCSPWVRTLAASQSYGMTEEETLMAFRIDGAQLPRLREMRAAFADGANAVLAPGLDPDDLAEAEWLLRCMGIRSDLARVAPRHVRGAMAAPGR